MLVHEGSGYGRGRIYWKLYKKLLLDKGHEVIVYDNLSTGYRDLIDLRATFVQGDILVKNKKTTPRQGDPRQLVADISKIKKDFGWKSKVKLNECLKKLWGF